MGILWIIYHEPWTWFVITLYIFSFLNPLTR
jgi:hypothetical protein